MPATSLAVEPFSGGACFINPPIWQGVIKQLVHLAQFSGGLQVVDGAVGSGKTVFAHHLDACLPDDVSCGVLALPSSLPANQVFDCVLTSLGVDVKDGQSVGQSIISLRQYDAQLKKEQLRKILIIDDAQNFDDQALAALASVFQGGVETEVGLALVFIGEPGTAQRLDALNLIDVEVRDCILPSFSLAEATELLTTEFSETHGDQPFPFDDDLVCALWNVADGRPGELLRLARAAWYEVGSAKEGWLTKFPIWHLLALAALIGVLAWGLVSQYLAKHNASAPTVSESASSQSAKTVISELTLTDDSIVNPDEVPVVLIDEGLTLPADSALDAPVVGFDATNALNETENTQGQAALEAARGGVESSLEAASSAAAVKQLRAYPPVEKKSSELGVAAPSEPITAKEPQKPAVASVPPRPDRPALEGLTADEATIMDMQSRGFVLQVSAAKSLEALKEFVSSQPNQASLRIYRSIRSGKSWFVVVEGFYADKDSALSAMSNLPSGQLKAGPWPKSVAAVKLEIAAYKQQVP